MLANYAIDAPIGSIHWGFRIFRRALSSCNSYLPKKRKHYGKLRMKIEKIANTVDQRKTQSYCVNDEQCCNVRTVPVGFFYAPHRRKL